MKYFSLLILIALLLNSCRFRGAKHITEAYSYCNGDEGEKIYYDCDSVNKILRKGRGLISYFTFIKGSGLITLKSKSGEERVVQVSNRGNRLYFHYHNGFGRNIWYSVKDTVATEQWHKMMRAKRKNCVTD